MFGHIGQHGLPAPQCNWLIKRLPVQGKLQRYWGQDPRLELIESSQVLPYRAEPLYDLAHFHSAMSATSACPASPLPGATPMNDTCALIHIVAAFHYIRRAAALPIPTAVSHPCVSCPHDIPMAVSHLRVSSPTAFPQL